MHDATMGEPKRPGERCFRWGFEFRSCKKNTEGKSKIELDKCIKSYTANYI